MDKKQIFKELKKIPIAPVLQEMGYSIDKDRTCKSWLVLERGKGYDKHKFLIPTQPNKQGHFHYQCINDDRRGDLADLLNKYFNITYKQILQTNSLSYLPPEPLTTSEKTLKKEKSIRTKEQNQQILKKTWATFKHTTQNYLTTRGIPTKIVEKYRKTAFKSNSYKAIFLAFNLEKENPKVLTAQVVETLYNKRKKRFLKGLTRGLGFLTPKEESFKTKKVGGNQLVITEGTEDALAYEALTRKEADYICTFGSLTKKGIEDIVKASLHYNFTTIAFDNDASGSEYTKKITKNLTIPHPLVKIPKNKDWVEDLLMKTN